MSIYRVSPTADPQIEEIRGPSPRGAAIGNKTVTRAGLADALSRRFGLPVRDSKEIVECVLDEITAAVARGENIKLAGFGSFNLQSKRARLGRNPRNGVEATISSRRVLSFKPSQNLRDLVQTGDDD